MSARLFVAFVVAGTAAFGLPATALAHGGHFGSGERFSPWNPDPLVLVPLLLAAFVYARGLRVLLDGTKQVAARYQRHAVPYFLGLAAVFVALVSPIDYLSTLSVSAHMVQHMLLMQVAAPLIVLGSPIVVSLVGLGRARRHLLALRRAGALRWLALLLAPLVVLGVHGLALLSWHLPLLYDLALANSLVHILEHAAFLVTAVMFWWVAYPSPGRRSNYPVSIALIFVMMLATGAVGALMTLSPAPWYAYEGTSGMTALEDQQLAGAIMWVIGGFLYAIPAAVLFVSLLNEGEQPAPVQSI
jgi:putative membrane protein